MCFVKPNSPLCLNKGPEYLSNNYIWMISFVLMYSFIKSIPFELLIQIVSLAWMLFISYSMYLGQRTHLTRTQGLTKVNLWIKLFFCSPTEPTLTCSLNREDSIGKKNPLFNKHHCPQAQLASKEKISITSAFQKAQHSIVFPLIRNKSSDFLWRQT